MVKYIEIEVKGIACENIDWICRIRMMVAGGLWNTLVECMFLVISECLDQLRDCDTVTQYCGAWKCVGVWQVVQT